jgi:aldose 1-epimerase
VDATLIPTGELAPVEGTPFDFRKPTAIGAGIDAASADHGRARLRPNWVLNRAGAGLQHAARVVEPKSAHAGR